MTLTGVLVDGRGANNRTMIVWENPGQYRVESGSRVATFDGSTYKTNGSSLSESEQDQIETLVGDSVEFFIFRAGNGVRARLLGRRFRADDGKAANYQGPLWDIILMMDSGSVRPDQQARAKMYYFDSITGLLSRVAYKKSGGVSVQTEVTQWARVDEQQVPGAITRKEANATVFSFKINTASFAPRGQASTFATP